MLDSLTASMQVSEESRNNCISQLQNCREYLNHDTGEISFSGYLKNLKVYTSGDWLNISGSIPKYYKGNNCENLSMDELTEALNQLSEDLGVDTSHFKVKRFDVSYTFAMTYHPANYFQMLIHHPRTEANSFNRGENGIQFVNQSITLSFYDKLREMGKKIKALDFITVANLLRYEWQQKRYVERVFGCKLLVADFMNPDIWERLIEKYKERYRKTIRSLQFGNAQIEELDQIVESLVLVKSYRDDNSYISRFTFDGGTYSE